MSHVTRHTSHITHHTSHVACHTSHITHHTSHTIPGIGSTCARARTVKRVGCRSRPSQNLCPKTPNSETPKTKTKPQTPNPKPQTPNPKPQTLNTRLQWQDIEFKDMKNLMINVLYFVKLFKVFAERATSRVTRHTSHVTRHTSHVERHTVTPGVC